MLTREEKKRRRSIAGQKAIESYWAEYHANIEAPNYHELPEVCFEIEVRNKISGKITLLSFRPADERRGRFRIYEDGKLWAICGWSQAMVHIRKRCKRTPLYVK